MTVSPASRPVALIDQFRVELRRTQVVSFDVFDTLVYRPGHFSPKDLFYRLVPTVAEILGRDVPDFVEQRIRAEKAARVRAWGSGVQDVGIGDIYRELGRRLQVRGEVLKRLIRCELEAESSVLEAQDIGKRLFEIAHESDRQVILLSDTYFDGDFLAEILAGCGYRDPGRVYASSDYGKTKDDGSLYRMVLDELGIDPARMLHVGDNVHSDFNVPLGLGIRSLHLPTDKGRMKSLHSVGDVASGSSFASAILSEVSERYWSESPGPSGTLGRSSLRLAVLYLAFAVWLVRRISGTESRTVYFASRDGLIMRRFFDLVARACGVEVRSRYLYVSRMALYPTLVHSAPELARALMAHSWGGLSVRAAVSRLALSYGQCQPLLSRQGLSDPDRVLDDRTAKRFSRFLEEAWPLVISGNEEHYALACEYLRQEAVLSNEPAAFVDVGWHGSLQNCLVRLLEHMGVRKGLEGHYLATFERPRGAPGSFVAEGYLLNNDEPRWISDLVRSGPSLIELFHGAPHGSVSGYRREAGKVVPTLDQDSEEQLQFEQIIGPVQEAAFEFVSEVLDRHRGLGVEPLPRDMVARIALSVIYQPDGDEARLFGRLKHAADFGGERRSLTGELEWDLSQLGPSQSFLDGTFPLWPPGFRRLKSLRSFERTSRTDFPVPASLRGR